MKRSLVSYCFALLFAAAVLYGAAPVKNVNSSRHPNIANAQSFVDLAYQKIVDAQKANEYDMGGHADKAKSLLELANKELKQAALSANQGGDSAGNGNVKRPEDAPDANVSGTKHPNIARAQILIEQAYASVVAAQRANEYDLDGHAEKAKTLLEQASSELKQAALAANK